MSEGVGEGDISTWGQFRAMVKYELLWNLRKKKVLGVVIITIIIGSLYLFLPLELGNGRPDPTFVLENLNITDLVPLMFGAAVAMNAISSEFEEGTIVPLASKPISRRLIYLGKLSAMFVFLFAIWSVLYTLFIVGGRAIYGPQNGLNLAVIAMPFLATLSTLVWASVVLVIASATKSSTLAVLGVIGVLISVGIVSGIAATTSLSGDITNYLPGSGLGGKISESSQSSLEDVGVAAGPDGIAYSFLLYTQDPSAKVDISEIEIHGSQVSTSEREESLAYLLGRSLAVVALYILVLNLLSWWIFERSEISES